MSKVNVGVVGVGAMGYNHVRVYSELENANLMAVSDLMRGTLAEVFEGVQHRWICVDYDNILRMPEIDCGLVFVYLQHIIMMLVMSAIEQGKHVLVEKPIAFHFR